MPKIPFQAIQKSAWIQSPTWDAVVVMSGFWLVAFAGLFQLVTSKHILNLPGALILVFLISQIHLAAPLFFVLTSSVFKQIKRERKFRYLGGVAVIALTCFGIFYAGLFHHQFWIVEGLAIAFLLWNTWHFSMQNFGILSIYTKLHQNQFEMTVKHSDRLKDQWFCWIQSFLLMPPIWWYSSRRLGLFLDLFPKSDLVLAKQIALSAVALSLALTGLMIFREFRSNRVIWPRFFYLLSMSLQPISGFSQYLPYHLLAYTLPHYLIEIGFMSQLQWSSLKDPSANQTSKFVRLGVFILGIMACALVTRFAFQYEAMRSFDSVGAFQEKFLVSQQDNFAFVLLASGAMTVFFSHFYLSRLIYSFRDSATGSQIWSSLVKLNSKSQP